jgi:predicted transcriptional regulator
MRTGGPEEDRGMTESRPGRIPVGDPIALRFDPETKHRLEQMAEGIGPRRFGALIRVACRRLVTQPKAVGNRLEEVRRLSEVRRAIPLVMLTLKLEPATARKFTALAAEHDTTISALMRIALHRFLEPPAATNIRCSARRSGPDCPRRSR